MPLPMHDQPSPSPLTIGIAAGKGGVGKSSVTVNLARALQTLGYQVGVLDADLYGPSIQQMLPEERAPKQEGGTIEPAWSDGIQTISIAHFRKSNEAAAVRAPIANGMITQLLQDVVWGSIDILLIDFPPGTGDVQITLAQKASLTGALMVTTPQELALLDVRKAANLFQRVQVPILGVVENMSYFESTEGPQYIFGQGGGKRFSEEIGVPLIAEIPLDPLFSRAADLGTSIFDDEECKSAQVYLGLGKSLMNKLPKKDKTFVSLKWVEMGSLGPFGFPPHSKGKVPNPSFKTIEQRDNHSFTIAWKDGNAMDYRLADLQAKCPCAGCNEKPPVDIDPNVRATKIQSVGRYGIRIQFSKGCSHGIFNNQFLRDFYA